ncbi:hypothetical protein RJZ57_008423, partial [Blastomyces gilchristii]
MGLNKKKKKGKKGAATSSDLTSKNEVTAAQLNETANPLTLAQYATVFSTGALSQVNLPPIASSFETEPPSNSAWNGVNPPIASNPYNTESPTVHVADGGDTFISSSPYETDIVQVHVGPIGGQRAFHVHLGILNQAPSLSSKINPTTCSAREHNSISLVNTDPGIFELVLMFLYIGKYLDCPYPPLLFRSLERNNDNQWPGADMEFEMHSLLYCFAQEYKMDELSALALISIENMTQVPYLNVLDVAKKAYPKLPDADNDDAYRERFRHETRVAMKENKDLIREPWVLDVFRNEHGNLTVDLFTTLTEPLRCDSEANNSETSPPEEPLRSSQSDKGKEGNVHLNGGNADYCTQEPTAASVVGEPALPGPEETIAEDIPEVPFEQVPEPPVSEPEPELESAKEPADIVEHAVDDGWGLWGGVELRRRMKKKPKKSPEPNPGLEPEGAPVEESPVEPHDWSGWGTKSLLNQAQKPDTDQQTTLHPPRRGKKKGKKKKMIEAPGSEPPPAPEPEVHIDRCAFPDDLAPDEPYPPDEPLAINDHHHHHKLEEEPPPPPSPPPETLWPADP